MTIKVERLSIQSLEIPFRISFSHASAERSCTQSVLVTATSDDGLVGHGEGCPREYVTGESIESAMAFFDAHRSAVRALSNLEAIRAFVAEHRDVIDANPAAWCAMELALLDLLGRATHQSFEELLNEPPLTGAFQYSAVLGADNLKVFEKLLGMYLDMGFTDYKVKLLGDLSRDQGKIDLLRAHLDSKHRIRFDANNCFADAVTAGRYLEALDCSFWAVEEPLAKDQYAELARLARRLETKIILDESFLRLAQFAELEGAEEFWLVNLRVSKMGGLLRSLEVVEACRSRGIPIIIGAQVGETSLLTRAALTVARSARDILMGQEGAFGTYLLERDVCAPPLMFTRGGRLEIDGALLRQMPGCGLEITS